MKFHCNPCLCSENIRFQSILNSKFIHKECSVCCLSLPTGSQSQCSAACAWEHLLLVLIHRCHLYGAWQGSMHSSIEGSGSFAGDWPCPGFAHLLAHCWPTLYWPSAMLAAVLQSFRGLGGQELLPFICPLNRDLRALLLPSETQPLPSLAAAVVLREPPSSFLTFGNPGGICPESLFIYLDYNCFVLCSFKSTSTLVC